MCNATNTTKQFDMYPVRNLPNHNAHDNGVPVLPVSENRRVSKDQYWPPESLTKSEKNVFGAHTSGNIFGLGQ